MSINKVFSPHCCDNSIHEPECCLLLSGTISGPSVFVFCIFKQTLKFLYEMQRNHKLLGD